MWLLSLTPPQLTPPGLFALPPHGAAETKPAAPPTLIVALSGRLTALVPRSIEYTPVPRREAEKPPDWASTVAPVAVPWTSTQSTWNELGDWPPSCVALVAEGT